MLAGMIALGSLLAARKASADDIAEEAKPIVWLVGGRLTLASIYYYGGGPSDQEKKWLADAQSWAQKIGIQVNEFPPGPTGPGQGLVELLKYFNEGGEGARIGASIRSKYGAYHGTLYDIAVKLLLMMRVYGVDAGLGDKFVQAIQSSATGIGLPQNLWTPPLSAVSKRASSKDVDNAVLQTEDDVLHYLVAAARGQKP